MASPDINMSLTVAEGQTVPHVMSHVTEYEYKVTSQLKPTSNIYEI